MTTPRTEKQSFHLSSKHDNSMHTLLTDLNCTSADRFTNRNEYVLVDLSSSNNKSNLKSSVLSS
jgi:hypothetical protein